jgi:menaquinone-dependent protoporphyrinogen IX oxidase
MPPNPQGETKGPTNGVAVVYASKYGTTKQYAEWIAEELGASVFDAAKVSPAKLAGYGAVVFGGALYAGGVMGAKAVAKSPAQTLALFTVGLADPGATDYSVILAKNFPPDLLARTKVFHLRGGIDYKKLGFVHRRMMAMLHRSIAKMEESQLTSENKAFLETYGKKVHFTDQSTIRPLVDYVRTLGRP